MKIAIGADHAGFAAKEEIKTVIKALGHAPRLEYYQRLERELVRRLSKEGIRV